MNITFVGKKPNRKVFEYSVVGNAKVDKIDFILTTTPSDIYSLSELADFLPFVKVQSVGLDYVDKIKTTSEMIDNNLVVSFTLQSKTTQYRNIAVQLQFENDEGRIIAQCEMVGLALSGNINADHEIPDRYPSVLVNLEYRISRLEQGITADTYSQEEIDEFLSHKQNTLTFDDVPTEDSENVVKSGGVYDAIENAKTIVFDDPNEHLNEEGLNKIYRPIDDNGNVDKSYVITKTFVPSTYVGITPHYTDNYDFVGDAADFVDDFEGEYDFCDVFGNDFYIGELSDVYSVYYNVNGEETYAIKFGTLDNNYGCILIGDCEPNKIIKVVVGKYFEYDQQGNKVFDEHCAFYCASVVGEEGIDVREITEERQEFELKTANDGSLYFDSDGNDLDFGTTRFFLYEIYTGNHERIEYNAKEIGSGASGGSNKIIELELLKSKKLFDRNHYTRFAKGNLRIHLRNFTESDIGTYLYLYKNPRQSKRKRIIDGQDKYRIIRNKGFRHPNNYDTEKNRNKYGYVSIATLMAKGYPLRPTPYFMAHNGAVQTEYEITEEHIAQGFMDIDISIEYLSLLRPNVDDNGNLNLANNWDFLSSCRIQSRGQFITYMQVDNNKNIICSPINMLYLYTNRQFDSVNEFYFIDYDGTCRLDRKVGLKLLAF